VQASKLDSAFFEFTVTSFKDNLLARKRTLAVRPSTLGAPGVEPLMSATSPTRNL
jgi:hypothetical protein